MRSQPLNVDRAYLALLAKREPRRGSGTDGRAGAAQSYFGDQAVAVRESVGGLSSITLRQAQGERKN